jgi:glycerol uptake facilitator protein
MKYAGRKMVQGLTACFGEFLGTFILVFFGTSAVAVTVLFNAFSGLVQTALVWGVGVTLAIYATRHLSCAHLNPAVSLGMVLAGRMRPRLLLPYWGAQLAGAMLAGGCVLLLFKGPIAGFEAANGIVRGEPSSIKTAMLFGEYFPNPGFALPWFQVSIPGAMLVVGCRRLFSLGHRAPNVGQEYRDAVHLCVRDRPARQATCIA